MNIDEVKKILVQSSKEKWSYAKTFDSLKNAGVIRYKTMVCDGKTIYVGIDGEYVAKPETKIVSLKIADKFDGRAVQEAVEHHQLNQTQASQFMGELARAGVVYYEVYMDTANVHYTTGDPLEAYIQPVPTGTSVIHSGIPAPVL